MPSQKHLRSILIVDDEVINHELLNALLSQSSFEITSCYNGTQALQQLTQNPTKFCAVLLDRMMPGMEGLEVLQKIRSNPKLQGLPVILQTAKNTRENIIEGMSCGAYYYLTKPFDQKLLLSVLQTAVKDWQQFRKLQQQLNQGLGALDLLTRGDFQFQTPEQARNLAALIATCYPDPKRVVLGLTELMINAVEHGNLSISYQMKSELLAAGCFDEEIAKRLQQSEYRHKRVTVTFERMQEGIKLSIQDEGQGFDWEPYLEVDPHRLEHLHGRGVAMAHLFCFDQIHYRAPGNYVETLAYSPTSCNSSLHLCHAPV